jgi:hypothetical protein
LIAFGKASAAVGEQTGPGKCVGLQNLAHETGKSLVQSVNLLAEELGGNGGVR